MKNLTLILAAVLAVAMLSSCAMRDATDDDNNISFGSKESASVSDVESAPVVTFPSGDESAPDVTETVPVQTKPAATAPPVTETVPAVTEPAVTEPVVTEPAVTEPVVTEPVVTDPPVTEPVATEPVNNGASAPAKGEITVVDGITYVNGILVVNKTYSLPADYNPGPDPAAENALALMFRDAAAEWLSLWVRSGVRTYNDQKWQYNVYVERDGQALADTYSARPGHSEHQSGLGFDINSIYKSFADTAEGQWLAANCHKYGFIIRYPAGKEHITGYMYEPWHVRYLGVDVATAVYESGLCLEEYLGITSAYTY